MTEAVLRSFDEADELFHHFAPKPLTTVDVQAQGREHRGGQPRVRPRAGPDEIDYLVAYFTGHRRNPTDVELTMFAQANSSTAATRSSTRRGSSTGGAASFAVRHDSHDARRHPQARQRLLGQRGGDGRRSGEALLRRSDQRAIRRSRRRDAHADEGGDAHHPTAISPFRARPRAPAAEIRDEGATGRGPSRRPGCAGSRCRT